MPKHALTYSPKEAIELVQQAIADEHNVPKDAVVVDFLVAAGFPGSCDPREPQSPHLTGIRVELP